MIPYGVMGNARQKLKQVQEEDGLQIRQVILPHFLKL